MQARPGEFLAGAVEPDAANTAAILKLLLGSDAHCEADTLAQVMYVRFAGDTGLADASSIA